MDGKRFDDATRVLGQAGSRRAVIKSITGAAVGGAIGLLAVNETAAARLCDTCTTHHDCGHGQCKSWHGAHYCCNGYWARGDCYWEKPHGSHWIYQWKSGVLYFLNRRTDKRRKAGLVCFTGVR